MPNKDIDKICNDLFNIKLNKNHRKIKLNINKCPRCGSIRKYNFFCVKKINKKFK